MWGGAMVVKRARVATHFDKEQFFWMALLRCLQLLQRVKTNEFHVCSSTPSSPVTPWVCPPSTPAH